MIAYLPLRLGDAGRFGLTACASAVILSRLSLAGAADRWGGLLIARLSSVTVAAGSGLLVVSGSVAASLVGAVLIGVGIANVYSALCVDLLDRVPPDGRGVALSLLGSCNDLGFFMGPSLAGLFAGRGISLSFACAAAVAFAGMLVLMCIDAEEDGSRGRDTVTPPSELW
jgi:predicted MFS family arabinose efflux permease